MKVIDEMQTSATKEKAEAALMQMHPDFDEIRDSDDFHNWADEQPKWVQDALYDNDNDARSAARAIDLYKADMGISKSKPTKDKDAAKSVSTKNSRSKPQEDESSTYSKRVSSTERCHLNNMRRCLTKLWKLSVLESLSMMYLALLDKKELTNSYLYV